MRTFLMTGNFAGEIELCYNDLDVLIKYDNRTDFKANQHFWLLSHLPGRVDYLPQFATLAPNLVIKEVKREITFADFWQMYFAGRNKDNSSKKKAEAKWLKMPKSEQIKAFNYISSYLSRLAYGTNPKYAETYLNRELWNN